MIWHVQQKVDKCYIMLYQFSYAVDTERKLNVHKTFRRCPGRLLNVLCTFNLRPVSTRYIHWLTQFNIRARFLVFQVNWEKLLTKPVDTAMINMKFFSNLLKEFLTENFIFCAPSKIFLPSHNQLTQFDRSCFYEKTQQDRHCLNCKNFNMFKFTNAFWNPHFFPANTQRCDDVVVSS